MIRSQIPSCITLVGVHSPASPAPQLSTMCVPVLLLEILLLCVCPLVHVHCYSTLCVYVHAIGVYRNQYVGCRIFWKGRDPFNFFFCYTRFDLCEFQLLLDLLCVCMVCTILDVCMINVLCSRYTCGSQGWSGSRNHIK